MWKGILFEISKEPNKEEISFLYKGKIKVKKKELEEVIDRFCTAFFKIKKISDNKELKGCCRGNKENLGNQSSNNDSIAFDMGKKH